MRILFRLAGLAALSLAGACCCSSTEPEGVRELAVIDYDDDGQPRITVPATARAGEPFTAVVVTRASGCVDAETDLSVSGATADITPYYIRLPPEGRTCPDGPSSRTREVVVRFAAPGQATVRVRGLRDESADTVVITRTVMVQPAS
jgi:hypothetical protein